MIKTQYLFEQINRLKNKKFEIAILSSIILDKDLSIVKPYSQYPTNSFYVDLYYPDLKFAIEIDEPYHNKQYEIDTERQEIIENAEKCEFYRIKTDDIIDIYETISELKFKIFQKIDELKDNGDFEPWIPKGFKMSQAQTDYPNAIFYKTNMGSDNKHDPLRGPLRINQEKRNNVDLFVTLSGGTVVSVYDIDQTCWNEFPDKKRGFYQTGKEIPNHPLISSGATSWSSTTNKMYGKNINKKLNFRVSYMSHNQHCSI